MRRRSRKQNWRKERMRWNRRRRRRKKVNYIWQLVQLKTIEMCVNNICSNMRKTLFISSFASERNRSKRRFYFKLIPTPVYSFKLYKWNQQEQGKSAVSPITKFCHGRRQTVYVWRLTSKSIGIKHASSSEFGAFIHFHISKWFAVVGTASTHSLSFPLFKMSEEKNLLSKCKEVCRRKVSIMSLETLMKVYVRISQPKNTLSQSLSFSALSLQQPNAISLHVFFICPFSPSLAVSGHVCCNFGACENQRENTFFFLHTIVIVLNSVCRCQINWTERHTTHIPVQYIERHIKTQPRKKKVLSFFVGASSCITERNTKEKQQSTTNILTDFAYSYRAVSECTCVACSAIGLHKTLCELRKRNNKKTVV